jgi:hypothetical protein
MSQSIRRTILPGLLCGLTALSPLLASPHPEAPAEAALDRPMFPDGMGHDFGEVVWGAARNHSLRIVNTTRGTIRVVNLKRH